MLKEINRARREYSNTGDTPRSFALGYEDGLDLLVEFSKSLPAPDPEIEEMLNRGDRAEIKAHLNKSTVYGMDLTVVDLVITGEH